MSPFRAKSKTRQSYKQKMHQEVLLSSKEQQEKERRLKRIKDYKETLYSSGMMWAFPALLLTQLIVAGMIAWIVQFLNPIIWDLLSEFSIESLWGAHK